MSDQPNHAERAHSELGASICSRWWNCPGSVRLSRGMPDRQTEHARRGTAAHELAQLCLQNQQDAIEYVGRTVAGVEVTPETADAVQVYLDDCRSLVPEWVLPSDVQIEVRFDLASFGPPAPMFGTADFVAYNPLMKKLWVKDYKNGFIHVDAATPQLKYYALGAIAALGSHQPVREVEVTICQPNGQAEPVRRVTYGALELAEWSIELMARARATQEHDAPLNPGDWCKFCPAAGTCPARARSALAVAQLEFADAVSQRDTTLPEIRLLSPADVGGILARADLLESWLKDVRALALAELQAGRDIPGWKLVESETRRRWKSDDAAALTLEALHEIDPWQPRKVLSPAQAEAAVAETMSGKTKKERVLAAKNAMANLTEYPRGGPRLAPVNDPRPALPAGGSEFTALPAETV